VKILVDSRWIAPHGLGRFASEIISRLPRALPTNLKISHLNVLNPILISLEIYLRKPDIYFSPGFNPPLFSSVPVVFTIGDLIHLHVKEERSFFKSLYYLWFLRFAARRAKAIITFSEFSKNQILDWCKIDPKKVIVVNCGVSDKFTPNGNTINVGFQYFLYIGNQKPHKNVTRLIKAFSQAKMPQEIKIILSGEPTVSLSELIIALNVQDRVVFAGLISEEDLPSYYRGAISLIFPSLYEGFGLPPLEAMACGTPVITSNVTSLPEVVGEAAISVDPYSVEAICEAMEVMVNDFDVRERLRSLGLNRAKMFSWDMTADIIKSTLSTKGF
jgi:glycosyltransferase involved in cell wall biosynthesis